MNAKKAIGLAAVALLTWRLIGRTAATALSLQFKISDLRIAAFGTNGTTTLRLNLVVKNPTTAAIRLRGLICDLLINGVKVGKINQRWAHSVEADSISTLPLYITINNSALSEQVWSNIKQGNYVDFVVGFEGKIYADNAWLPLYIDFNGREFLNLNV